uniref:Uncharacterized protein n=1 Tax=Siphoviridae sp. ctgn638 TaxID=2827913 RepID=A0A8S5TL88_9CAUD|nr:MAG TPA: hypothetical protein [Siphoviridae sp. ctgn638]
MSLLRFRIFEKIFDPPHQIFNSNLKKTAPRVSENKCIKLLGGVVYREINSIKGILQGKPLI